MLQRGKRKTQVFEEIVREAEHNTSELHSFPHRQTSRRMPETYLTPGHYRLKLLSSELDLVYRVHDDLR